MNRQRILVDVSHVSDKTFYDALEISRAPLIASHSSFCEPQAVEVNIIVFYQKPWEGLPRPDQS